jgi:hypothetical protein
VPRAGLACGRVGNDGDGMAAAGQASIKALVGVSCLHGHWLVYSHGMGNHSPMCVGGGARTGGSRRVSGPTYQTEPGGGRAR